MTLHPIPGQLGRQPQSWACQFVGEGCTRHVLQNMRPGPGGPGGPGPGDPVLLILRFHAGDGHTGSGLTQKFSEHHSDTAWGIP